MIRLIDKASLYELTVDVSLGSTGKNTFKPFSLWH